jgi:hypothetical protein
MATVRDTYNMQINGGSGNDPIFDQITFYAPVGDDGEVVQVSYQASGTGSTRLLQRKAGTGNWASFGVKVERLDITGLRADGTVSDGPYSDELPVAVTIEIRIQDAKERATIALTSSAFLPGGGF